MSPVIAFPRDPFTVTVEFDAESGMWVGSCDALYLATEAETYEALTARIWEIAPELAELNGLGIAPESLRLRLPAPRQGQP